MTIHPTRGQENYHARKQVIPPSISIERERSSFKPLLAQIPNYFGNLVHSPFKPVKTILGNPTYEEISCIGFNPDKDLLEATIKVRLPGGYGSDLCHAGTHEYVRFYLDYGSGWKDAGVAGFNIHDIPNSHDCAGSPDSSHPNTVTTPSNPPVSTTREPATTPTSTSHDTWKLYTTAGPHPDAPPTIDMRACGYIVRLDVYDRSIVNGHPDGHNTGDRILPG